MNFDDYVRTDSGFNNHRSGWLNGDFDFGDSVNFDDYVLIDNAFNTQGARYAAAQPRDRVWWMESSDRYVAMRRLHSRAMALSARNQFPGTVTSITGGSVMSEVIIDIGGGHRIVSLISTSSVKRMKLKKGGPAVAVIKATEVIVSTDEVEQTEGATRQKRR